MVRTTGTNGGHWIRLTFASMRVGMLGFLLALTMIMALDSLAIQASAGAQPYFVDTEAPVVVRAHFEDTAQLNALAAELDIWEVDHGDRTFVALLTADQHEQLIEEGLKVTVLQDRTAEVINAPVRAERLRSAGVGEPMDGGIPYYPCYRTVEETYADLADLAATYPGLASWSDIGDSWDKQTAGGATGYDVNALTLTNKSIPGPKPRLAVIAAIHAREYATAELATRFAEHLVGQYGIDPDITWLLDYTEFHLIPIANPDGRKWAEAGYLWRKNTHDSKTCGYPGEVGINVNEGVDLNRNSSFKWNGCTTYGCSSGDMCSIIYRGAAAASEPETQVIEEYMRSLFPDRRCEEDVDAAPSDNEGLFISLHSYSELILYPWGWTDEPSSNGIALQSLGRKFGYYTGYEVCQIGAGDCLYLADGTTDDWSYGELGVASYTFELGTRFFEACTVFETQIVDRGINSLTYAMKASRRPYEAPSGPEVTDVTASVAFSLSIASAERVTVIPSLAITAGVQLTLEAVADDTRFESNGHGSEPSQAIASARYTVDAPSWITGTVNHPMEVLGLESSSRETIAAPSTSALIRASVDTIGWGPGRHLLIVEAQDADGQWGVPTAIAVQVQNSNVNSQLPDSVMPSMFDDYVVSNGTSSSLNSLLGLSAWGYSQEPLECKSTEVLLNQALFLPAITN